MKSVSKLAMLVTSGMVLAAAGCSPITAITDLFQNLLGTVTGG